MLWSYAINFRSIKVIGCSVLLLFSTGVFAKNSVEPLALVAQQSEFRLISSAFSNGAAIPELYTCEGENLNPELTWVEPPAGTASFALLVIDPDAMRAMGKKWKHWMIWGIPKTVNELSVATKYYPAGQNSSGNIGYDGPCPPDGKHRYYFVLYALDVPILDLQRGASFNQFIKAVDAHTIEKTALVGTYTRNVQLT
jgi:Raf kinase inhibitor-like YbhB/YbcL family protein